MLSYRDVALMAAGFAVMWLVLSVIAVIGSARAGVRLGMAVKASRRTIADAAKEREVPELFKLDEERRREQVKQRKAERAGKLPHNFRRPGITEDERNALQYQLETGKLDKAIDAIAKEETK